MVSDRSPSLARLSATAPGPRSGELRNRDTSGCGRGHSSSPALAVGMVALPGLLRLGNDYVFFAGYVVLQFIVLATAWNILGGYCGYVNFGTAAFFAHRRLLRSVALHKLGANTGRYLPRHFVADVLHAAVPPLHPDAGHAERDGRGRGRLRHGLPDAEAARRVLRHRHAGHGRGAADADHQLGFRRRLARRLRHPTGQASRSAG